MKLFVLDAHTIYRRGLVACLDLLDEVESVADAECVRESDRSPPGGEDFAGAVREGLM